MEVKMNEIKDLKHWFGWILSTTAVIIIFNYLGICLYKPWYYALILLGVIVGIDLIKHKIKWQ